MPIGSYKNGSISFTNEPAGTSYYYFGFTDFEYFNIHTFTLTGATVSLEGTLDDLTWRDVTADLFGSATFSSDTEYLADTYMTYKDLRIKVVLATGTNTVNVRWMVKKGGGR